MGIHENHYGAYQSLIKKTMSLGTGHRIWDFTAVDLGESLRSGMMGCSFAPAIFIVENYP